MAFVFEFPDVGEGIHEGRVVEWLVSQGDTVTEDQPLVKVETDKAVVELPAPRGGVVLQIHAVPDDTIHVGDPLVSLGEAGEKAPATAEADPKPDAGATSPAASAGAAPVVENDVEGAMSGDKQTLRRPLATPSTRALARRLGVDLVGVQGSGKGGRITDDDVQRAAAGAGASVPEVAPEAAAAGPAPASGVARTAPAAGRREDTLEGPVERVALTHLRKVIAEAMIQSKHTSAHVTHVDEADVTELVAFQKAMKAELAERHGVRFTLLPFFIKALVTALREHPEFNASFDEERAELVLKRYYNIGIAVDTPEGLIVPVVKNADRKDMLQLAAEVADLAQRARERRLGLDELRGGTCTLTNIGPLGGILATPVIRQPELAIVGLHAIKERPVVAEGEIAVRKMMYLSVSFDHRMIDGAQAARFMSNLVRLVSNPKLLMVRL